MISYGVDSIPMSRKSDVLVMAASVLFVFATGCLYLDMEASAGSEEEVPAPDDGHRTVTGEGSTGTETRDGPEDGDDVRFEGPDTVSAETC